MDALKYLLKKIDKLEFQICCLRNQIGEGGDDTNFAINDLTFTGDRHHDFDGFDVFFEPNGGKFGIGGAPTTFFNVIDETLGTDLISMDTVNYQSIFNASDGNSFSSFSLNSDLVGSNVQFIISSTDNTNLVQITGDALLQQINLGADLGISINSSYVLPLADGTANYVMTTDGAGVVTWQPGGGGGGTTYTVNNALRENPAGNFKLGGPLIENTTINTTGFYIKLNATSNFPFWITSAGDYCAYMTGLGATTVPLVIESLNQALIATSTGFVAGAFNQTHSSTNTSRTALAVGRTTTGTPANGLGVDIQFQLEDSAFDANTSNALISKFTDIVHATRTSEFSIQGVNSAVLATLFTLSGNGSTRLNKYGVGSFLASEDYLLGVDASGNVVEVDLGSIGAGGAIADNGLHIDGVTGGVYLGGDLVVGQGGAVITGSEVSQAVLFQGITYSTDHDFGVLNALNDGDGVAFTAFVSDASDVAARFIVKHLTELDDIKPAIAIWRRGDGNIDVATGIGSSIDFVMQSNLINHPMALANQIISKWSDANGVSSELSFVGVDNTTIATLFAISGNGSLRAYNYGLGTFLDTPDYLLGVDSNGSIIEVSLGGGGGGGGIYGGSGTLPSNVAVDLDGNIFTLESGAVPLLKIDAASEVIRIQAGVDPANTSYIDFGNTQMILDVGETGSDAAIITLGADHTISYETGIHSFIGDIWYSGNTKLVLSSTLDLNAAQYHALNGADTWFSLDTQNFLARLRAKDGTYDAGILFNANSSNLDASFNLFANDGFTFFSILSDLLSGTITYTSPSHIFVGDVLGLVNPADDFANDAAASAGSVQVGQLYHTSGVVKLRLV